MVTKVAIDSALLDRALRIGGEPTLTAAVAAALREYIARREQAKIVELFGQAGWNPDYEYKEDRGARASKTLAAEDLESLEATMEPLADPAAQQRIAQAEKNIDQGKCSAPAEVAMLMEERRHGDD